MAAFRLVNLFPLAVDSFYYILTNSTDTLLLGVYPFVGPEAQPNNLSGFNFQILNGAYGFGIMTYDVLDSTLSVQPIDSLYFTGGAIYTLLARGQASNGPGADSMIVSLLQHN
jgi:hypothetical protein